MLDTRRQGADDEYAEWLIDEHGGIDNPPPKQGKPPPAPPPPPPPAAEPWQPPPAKPPSESEGGVGRSCEYFVYYEQWYTAGDERVCPECGPLNGRRYVMGEGPQPPLHDNCRCRRTYVYGECWDSGGYVGPA